MDLTIKTTQKVNNYGFSLTLRVAPLNGIAPLPAIYSINFVNNSFIYGAKFIY